MAKKSQSAVVNRRPSEHAGKLFVSAVNQTLAAGGLVHGLQSDLNDRWHGFASVWVLSEAGRGLVPQVREAIAEFRQCAGHTVLAVGLVSAMMDATAQSASDKWTGRFSLLLRECVGIVTGIEQVVERRRCEEVAILRDRLDRLEVMRRELASATATALAVVDFGTELWGELLWELIGCEVDSATKGKNSGHIGQANISKRVKALAKHDPVFFAENGVRVIGKRIGVPQTTLDRNPDYKRLKAGQMARNRVQSSETTPPEQDDFESGFEDESGLD